ncbi:zinc finger, CCHC-type containing protein [Tanacetum coccineum]
MAAATMKHLVSNFVKLDNFKGVDFRRWQKKMHFLLSSMSVVYVLTTPIPEDGENATVDQIRRKNKWDNDDYVCRGLILKVMKQYNKLFGILGRFTRHKMNMDKAIQVSCIIDKLPPSWKDFKHNLKHLKEELTLVELGSHLRIEESLRVQDSDKPKGNNVVGPLVVNMMEHNNSTMYNDNKGKRKHHDNTRADPNKKAKPTCWKCGKTGHTKRDCKGVNVCNKVIGSGIKGSVDGSSNSLKGHNMAVVRLPGPKLETLGERGNECIFVGYAEHSKVFMFFVIEPNESVSINSIIESRDAIFDENTFFLVPRPSLRILNRTEDIGGSVVPEEVTKEDDPKTFDKAMKSQDVAF